LSIALRNKVIALNSEVSIGDIADVLLLIAAIIGIYYTNLQMRSNYKTQKAIFFKDLYSTMYSDPEIIQIFYKIEYDKFIYSSDFHKSDDEKRLDRLLSFLDLICNLYEQKIITDHEMESFRYRIRRVYINYNIQSYLVFLENFFPQTGAETRPFQSFVSYCERTIRETYRDKLEEIKKELVQNDYAAHLYQHR
jgi:hypothetical protein